LRTGRNVATVGFGHVRIHVQTASDFRLCASKCRCVNGLDAPDATMSEYILDYDQQRGINMLGGCEALRMAQNRTISTTDVRPCTERSKS
jgi:hypothetical protein